MCASFPSDFEGGMWDLIVLIPFYLIYLMPGQGIAFFFIIFFSFSVLCSRHFFLNVLIFVYFGCNLINPEEA